VVSEIDGALADVDHTRIGPQAADPLDQDRIDMVWRTFSVGIGRPDPLG
jgi:hypothetical protein